jgi:hypothetical protein
LETISFIDAVAGEVKAGRRRLPVALRGIAIVTRTPLEGAFFCGVPIAGTFAAGNGSDVPPEAQPATNASETILGAPVRRAGMIAPPFVEHGQL